MDNVTSVTTNVITLPPLDLSLDQVHERILQLMQQGQGNGYQIGRLYNYVVDSGLAQKGSFKDAQAFFRKRVKVLGQTVLSRNGTVARNFSEAVAMRYGISNLYTLLSYAQLAKIPVESREPGPTLVELTRKDGTVQTKPFKDCTVQELQRAVNRLKPATESIPQPHEDRVQRFRDSLMRHFPDQHSIKVDARKSPLGELLITLRDIPETQMRRLVAVLLEESAPVDPGAPAQGTESDGEAPAPDAPEQPLLRAASNDNTAASDAPVEQTRHEASRPEVANSKPEAPAHDRVSHTAPRPPALDVKPPEGAAPSVTQGAAAHTASAASPPPAHAQPPGSPGHGPTPVAPGAQAPGTPGPRLTGLGAFLRRTMRRATKA